MNIDFKKWSRCWNVFVEIHMNSNYSGFQQYLGRIILPNMISLSGQLNDIDILSWMLYIISRWTILLCWGLHSMTNFSHGIQGLLVAVYFALPEHKCNICLTLKYYYALTFWVEVTELWKSALHPWFSIKESPMQN